MNLAVKLTISGIGRDPRSLPMNSGILRDFEPGKHVENPDFTQLGILVRSSTGNKIMSQTPPQVSVRNASNRPKTS